MSGIWNERTVKKPEDFRAALWAGPVGITEDFALGYATALYEAGVDFKLAQKFLGHAQLSTTMDIYTDILDTRIDKVAAQMDAAF